MTFNPQGGNVSGVSLQPTVRTSTLQPALTADTIQPAGQISSVLPAETTAAPVYNAAAVAEAARRANLRRNFTVTADGYRDAASQAGLDTANKYQNDVEKFLATIQNAQDTTNTGLVNNALNLRRSMSSIAGGVRDGLRSGGVQLANMNAMDSGAAEAMARAYATMGQQQSNDANNEALLAENELMATQRNINRDRDEGLAGFDRFREAEISRIRGDLRNKLALLDAEAAAEGIGGVVDLSAVDSIVNEAMGRLSSIDSMRNSRIGGIRQLGAGEINQRAAEMDAMGAAGTSPFLAGNGPVSTSVTDRMNGAAISQLPIFVRNRDDR